MSEEDELKEIIARQNLLTVKILDLQAIIRSKEAEVNRCRCEIHDLAKRRSELETFKLEME